MKLWMNISEVMEVEKGKDKFPIYHFLNRKSKIVVDDIKAPANVMNEYYVSVGANLASAVPTVVRDEII